MDNFDFDFGAYEESAAEKEITLTEEQLDKLLLICEERVMARVKEEILKPIQEKLYSIYQKNAEVNEEIRELKEQVDYLYKPTKEEKGEQRRSV